MLKHAPVEEETGACDWLSALSAGKRRPRAGKLQQATVTVQRVAGNVNRSQRPDDRCQARAQRRQAVVVQLQVGKTRRRPVAVRLGLARVGRAALRRTVGPATVRGARLEATERVKVDGQRRDVVTEVELVQTETVVTD